MPVCHEINDRLTVFDNVLNVFDIDPQLDRASTYHIYTFNPAWAGPNIMGRYFRIGAKVNF